jgi:toxin ParE1/3/4
MKEPTLTDRAKDDLLEIWHRIAANRDERAADRFTAKILDKRQSHAQFPESSPLRTEISPGLRSFPVAPYVVFYRPYENTLLVVRILHGHRDVKRIMRREELS